VAERNPVRSALTLLDWKGFLNWWFDGLKRCLPRRLRDSLGPSGRHVLAMVERGFTLQLHDADTVEDLAHWPSLPDAPLSRWLGSGRQRKALHLRLPRAAVFTRTVTLPSAAAANLRRVLRFEMDRLTPFAEQEVLFDCRVVGRRTDKQQLDVELAVTRKTPIETPLAQLEAAGHPPWSVDGPGLWEGANLLRGEASHRNPATPASTWWAIVLLGILVIAVLATPLWQARSVVVELDGRLQQARQQAGTVTRLQRQLDDASALTNFVRLRRQERVPTVELLRALTEDLPDDTWLQQLAIRGDNVELQGESARATLLIELLEQSPYFDSVAFRAPLTKARDAARDRFSIVMKLTPREQP